MAENFIYTLFNARRKDYFPILFVARSFLYVFDRTLQSLVNFLTPSYITIVHYA